MIRRQKLIGIVASVALAAIGTALLVAYVHSAAADSNANGKTVGVLVVNTTIPKGTKAEDIVGNVRLMQVPIAVASPDALNSTASLAGKVTSVDLMAGEQLLASRFAPAAEVQGLAPGMLQVTVAMDALRAVGGEVRKGDLVAVALSFGDPETTRLVLQKVRVTDVRTPDGVAVTSPITGTATTGTMWITLAVDAPSAEKVIFGAEHGTIWLSWEPKDANEAGTKVQTKQGVNL